MFNLNNANMENLITQINKERLVNSDTALMMKELYYYVPCEYWYDKQDRLRTDIEGRNTPMYMCECPTLAAIKASLDFESTFTSVRTSRRTRRRASGA